MTLRLHRGKARSGFVGALLFLLLAVNPACADEGASPPPAPFSLKGGLSAYWNVREPTGAAERQARSLGFRPLTLIDTYAGHPGNRKGLQQESVTRAIGKRPGNPWSKPAFFEQLIRQNIRLASKNGVLVNDIEFVFRPPREAWADVAVRKASGASSFSDFERAYIREWASWYALPCKWVKEERPGELCGIYGRQPFNRDYAGYMNKTSIALSEKHEEDAEIWKYIDPYVDFYTSSIYIMYNRPDAIFYMAANVEENYKRSRVWGDKPVFAYEWLKLHTSYSWNNGEEVEPYQAEAMAIVPFFSGARAVVLWGYEPHWRPGNGPIYARLGTYTRALARVAKLSEKIGRGRLVIDESAQSLWQGRRPLVRRIELGSGDCVIMAVNPWQDEAANSRANASCGGKSVEVTMTGRHVTLAEVKDGRVSLY